MSDRPVSGHVFRYEGKRRATWRAKYRLPDGRQVQKTLGPAWTERGRPPAGYFTRRSAEAWLRRRLVEAATASGSVAAGATVADACAEYLRYVEHDRQRKPSTLRDYDSIFRNYVLTHLGEIELDDLSADRVEHWAAQEIDPEHRLASRTREKTIVVFHGVMAATGASDDLHIPRTCQGYWPFPDPAADSRFVKRVPVAMKPPGAGS